MLGYYKRLFLFLSDFRITAPAAGAVGTPLLTPAADAKGEKPEIK